MIELALVAGTLAAGSCAAWAGLRSRGMDRWIGSYARQAARRGPLEGPVHLILAIADHYEPKIGQAPPGVARGRVERWVRDYPRQFGGFRDSDGRPPRHSFFYPVEEYEPEYLDALAGLCRDGYGEVEIHLHHDNDTAENLRQTLSSFRDLLVRRHGLLARDRRNGEPVYAFIHGNWALDNSLPGGHWCGVNNELDVLRETGCYADFTLPSAPSLAQTRKINSLYYAIDDPLRPKSHDWGHDVGRDPAPAGSLLMVQGPLMLDWSRRKWGFLPGIEAACVQAGAPASVKRLDLWLRARVQVPSRPDWYFVKLHCHGGWEAHFDALLGEPMVRFHRDLAQRARQDERFHYHYVTAREMANLIKAAEAGWTGSVADARDYLYVWDAQDAAIPRVAGPGVPPASVLPASD
jgi:hypothetical protein